MTVDTIGYNNLKIGDTYRLVFYFEATNGTTTLTKTSSTYFVKVMKNPMEDLYDNLVSNYNSVQTQLDALRTLLTAPDNDFFNLFNSTGDSFYATIDVKDASGNSITVIESRKSFG
jgi:hypothetical protein